ncbi:chaperonin 10-like protein [Gaertneriomyces semiglobifer]|nr:chaperonin 10-like protein [Gaertneriomyces semiglobifer]
MTTSTMKAAVVLDYGDKDPIVEMKDDVAKPVRRSGKRELLVKVLACSTAFGDVHMLSGRLSLVLKPPQLPYIPGKDICGIVEQVDGNSAFKVGDVVVASRDFSAYGGLAEYAVVQESKACLKPDNVDVLTAAACADSAITAMRATELACLKQGERVLVLGGSGGVGSVVIQLAVHANSSYVATTSTQQDMCKGLGVAKVIDYQTENWWDMEEFKSTKFDVIVDCVGGNDHYTKAQGVLKDKSEGGRFVAVVGDEPLPNVKTVMQLASFASSMIWKSIWTKVWRGVPSYVTVASSTTQEYLEKVMALVKEGKLKIVMETSGPFPFTAQGVKDALALQASRHAHGKVVVKVE